MTAWGDLSFLPLVMTPESTREKAARTARGRAIAALLPLTFVVIFLLTRMSAGRSGPYHGIIERVLAVTAVLGAALLWIGVLRLPKGSSSE